VSEGRGEDHRREHAAGSRIYGEAAMPYHTWSTGMRLAHAGKASDSLLVMVKAMHYNQASTVPARAEFGMAD
jgi:hypothetical protein